MSNLAGLGIALLTILAVCCLWFVIRAVFWLAGKLQEMIFDHSVHVLWKIIFLIPWLIFRLITVVFLIVGLLCGISLAKDFFNWFRK